MGRMDCSGQPRDWASVGIEMLELGLVRMYLGMGTASYVTEIYFYFRNSSS